jgi:DNA polymerase V
MTFAHPERLSAPVILLEKLHLVLPYYGQISAGFPSPADDYIEDRINLKEYLVHNEEGTYVLQIGGDSMLGAGLSPGDRILVDKSLEPKSGDIVVAALHGEFTVKRLVMRAGRCLLEPANPAYRPMDVTEEPSLQIWGVVTRSIKEYRRL